MSKSVLVGYASSYGSTREVAAAIAETLSASGLTADLQALSEVKALASYQAVVMGAPLIMFHWHKDARNFLARHKGALLKLPVAVFVLGPVHDPYDTQEWQDSRDQLAKELANFPWFKPIALEMFGGRYDPALLRFPLKQMAGKEPASDLRDWEAIRRWSGGLAENLFR